MANTIVTTATNPSGIAATARAIATKNVSKITLPSKEPFLIRPKINTNKLIPILLNYKHISFKF